MIVHLFLSMFLSDVYGKFVLRDPEVSGLHFPRFSVMLQIICPVVSFGKKYRGSLCEVSVIWCLSLVFSNRELR